MTCSDCDPKRTNPWKPNELVLQWATSFHATAIITEFTMGGGLAEAREGDPGAPGITGIIGIHRATVAREREKGRPRRPRNYHRNRRNILGTEHCPRNYRTEYRNNREKSTVHTLMLRRSRAPAKTTSRLNCIRDCNGLLFADCKT